MRAPAENSMGRLKRSHVLLLLSILAFAAVIRFTGIDFLLPCNAEPDKHLVSQARQIRGDRAPFYPAYGAYPHFLATLLSLLPAKEKPPRGASLEEHLQACSAKFLQGRKLMSLLGVATVLLTYFLARRFHDRGPSLLAAGLLASSLLHTLYSNQARPHVGAALLTNLALLAAIHLAARPSPRSFWLASVTFVLAFCSLQTAVFALPALAIGVWCFLFGQRKTVAKEPRWILGPWPHVILAGVVGVLALRQFYPFVFSPPGGDSTTTPIGNLKFPHHFDLSKFNLGGLPKVLEHLWQHDPTLMVLAAIAAGPVLLKLFASRPRCSSPTTMMLTFVAPYLAVLFLWSDTWARLLLPLLPALCIFAAVSLIHVTRVLSRIVPSRNLSEAFAVLLILAVPVSTVIKFARLKVAPDSLSMCVAWLEQTANGNSEVIATPPWLSLPVLRNVSASARVGNSGLRLPWVRYQAHLEGEPSDDHAYQLAPLHWNGEWPKHVTDITTATDHAAILSSIDPTYAILSPRPGAAWGMELAVSQWGKRVASFGGSQDGGLTAPFRWPYQCDNTFLRIWKAQEFGPALQVYAPKTTTTSPRSLRHGIIPHDLSNSER